MIQQIKQFIESQDESYGKILALYGLRRTGKTTMMEQTAKFYSSLKRCAFFEITNNDSINDIKNTLIEEKKKGTEVICLDEITKAKDFITNSAILPDIFAKENMKIIVAGDHSLGFVLAKRYLNSAVAENIEFRVLLLNPDISCCRTSTYLFNKTILN